MDKSKVNFISVNSVAHILRFVIFRFLVRVAELNIQVCDWVAGWLAGWSEIFWKALSYNNTLDDENTKV